MRRRNDDTRRLTCRPEVHAEGVTWVVKAKTVRDSGRQHLRWMRGLRCALMSNRHWPPIWVGGTVAQSRYRFTISQLLLVMAILAIALAGMAKAPFFVVTSSVISLFWVFGLARMKQGRNLLALFAVVLPIEFGCGLLAFHTIGEIVSVLYRLLLLLNLIFLAVFVIGFRRSAFVAILLLAFCIVPYQLTLGIRWWLVHSEAVRVVEFAKQAKSETGAFPVDLSTHRFRNSSVKQYIYYSSESDTFRVSYYIGTPNTSHWCDNGGDWEYYPD